MNKSKCFLAAHKAVCISLAVVGLAESALAQSPSVQLLPLEPVSPLLKKSLLGRTPVKAPFVPGRVLVAFKDSQRAMRFDLVRHGLKVDEKVKSDYFTAFKIVEPGKTVDQAVTELRRDPSVRIAEPDFIVSASQAVPNDPLFPQLWGLYNEGQTGGTPGVDIGALFAWQITKGSPTVRVAVIDSGVNYNHPDLSQNILKDAAGKVVGTDAYEWDNLPLDQNGHGTHCAGTIAARYGNGLGVVGVAPSIKIIPCRFLGPDGNGATSSAIYCIDFARRKGAKIMSNSWGGGGFSRLLLEAVQRTEAANILFVAAAGNDGKSVDDNPNFPAGLNMFTTNMLSVGATDHNDQIASFSNYGRSVDIAAPGVGIVSTYLNTYKSLDGTSMATPHVSGAAALVASAYPGLSAQGIRARLLGGSVRVGGLGGLVNMERRLNAYNALENDTTAPAAPTKLKGVTRSSSAIEYQMVSPGDDGVTGPVSYLDIRYSYAPITAANFQFAIPANISTGAIPGGAGVRFVLKDLRPNVKVYCAVRGVDNVGNAGPIANALVVTTRATPLYDPFTTIGKWVKTGTWGVTSEVAYTGTTSMTDSPSGSYEPNSDTVLALKTAVPSSGPMILYFNAAYALETNYDFLGLDYSTDNGAHWISLGAVTGFSDWQPFSVFLPAGAGSQIKVRFILHSDDQVQYDGVYIDDLRLATASAVLYDNANTNTKFVRQTPWNTTSTTYLSPTKSWTDSPAGLYPNNMNKSITSTNPLDARGMLPAFLMFGAVYSIEPGYDSLWVELSQDNTNYFPYMRFSGENTNWGVYSLDVSNTSRLFKVRYRMTSDASGVGDGAYLDDIGLFGETAVAIP